MKLILPKSLIWIPESTVEELLKYYDYPHPEKKGEIISGYDKGHVIRTAKMRAVVAKYLGHNEKIIYEYQISCFLHDLGRAGLDQKLFGEIWSWAKNNNIPTRPLEWRKRYPDTIYGKETEAFLDMFSSKLRNIGIENVDWTREHVEMRLGYASRFKRQMKRIKPKLKKQDIEWKDWMEKVVLYYYYPEKMNSAPAWTRELGEILVACEQLEAYSNRNRGNDYYNRGEESFSEALGYLNKLMNEGRIGKAVLLMLRKLLANGLFDDILKDARDGNISKEELDYLSSINAEENVCQ